MRILLAGLFALLPVAANADQQLTYPQAYEYVRQIAVKHNPGIDYGPTGFTPPPFAGCKTARVGVMLAEQLFNEPIVPRYQQLGTILVPFMQSYSANCQIESRLHKKVS